uniref:Uncharacterized protein n=1 Tax=Zea mays TaxID=4577 RepID=A0A804R9I7_MAIZE
MSRDRKQACIVETDSQVMQVEEEQIEPLREQRGTQQPPGFGQCGKNGESLEHGNSKHLGRGHVCLT